MLEANDRGNASGKESRALSTQCGWAVEDVGSAKKRECPELTASISSSPSSEYSSPEEYRYSSSSSDIFNAR